MSESEKAMPSRIYRPWLVCDRGGKLQVDRGGRPDIMAEFNLIGLFGSSLAVVSVDSRKSSFVINLAQVALPLVLCKRVRAF